MDHTPSHQADCSVPGTEWRRRRASGLWSCALPPISPPARQEPRREGTRQEAGRARTVADRRPGARDRPRRRAHQGAAHRHLRHRPAHPQVGRLGAADHPHPDDHRPRVRRRGRGARPGGHRRQRRRPGQRRGPPGLRQVPQLPGRAAPPVPQHGGPGRQPGRRVRRVRRAPRLQRLGAPGAGRPGRGGDLRPVRQRRAHRALLPAGRRGRAGHRRWPDRHHGGRGRQARRCPARDDHRRQPVPPGPGPQGRRLAGAGRLAAHHRGGPAEARPARGLRRGPGDVRPPRGAALDDRQHDARRQDRHARPARRGVRDRLGEGGHLDDHHQGHLRARDVRDLVRDVGAAGGRARPDPGDHRPVPGAGLRGRVRRGGRWSLRQDHSRLDLF